MSRRAMNAKTFSFTGASIQPGAPSPFLRRTLSGHLFESDQSLVKNYEKTLPVPIDGGPVDEQNVYYTLHERFGAGV